MRSETLRLQPASLAILLLLVLGTPGAMLAQSRGRSQHTREGPRRIEPPPRAGTPSARAAGQRAEGAAREGPAWHTRTAPERREAHWNGPALAPEGPRFAPGGGPRLAPEGVGPRAPGRVLTRSGWAPGRGEPRPADHALTRSGWVPVPARGRGRGAGGGWDDRAARERDREAGRRGPGGRLPYSVKHAGDGGHTKIVDVDGTRWAGTGWGGLGGVAARHPQADGARRAHRLPAFGRPGEPRRGEPRRGEAPLGGISWARWAGGRAFPGAFVLPVRRRWWRAPAWWGFGSCLAPAGFSPYGYDAYGFGPFGFVAASFGYEGGYGYDGLGWSVGVVLPPRPYPLARWRAFPWAGGCGYAPLGVFWTPRGQRCARVAVRSVSGSDYFVDVGSCW